MSQSYTRQSSFADGDTITAALFNNEYNQLVNAFSYSSTNEATTGHRHDGSAGEGGNIPQIGDLDFLNKIVVDSTNNRWGFYVEVSSVAVEQLRLQDGALIPVTDSDVDLGTSSLYFKDAYIDSVTTTGNVSIGGNLTVTGNATISGNLTFGDADTDSINLAAEINSDIIPNTDGTYDLGSATKEWQDLYIDGTANIDSLVADTADINGGTIDGATIATSDITVGAGKTLDVSSGTLTLADDQISGDKVEGGTIAATTITSLTATSADINGGTIDGVTIGGTTAGAVTFTDLSDGTITIAGFADEDNMVSNSATLLPTQQSVKAYVDAQVTAQDLDITTDSGTIAIDLDSETLTVTGGTGLDSSATGNAVTLAIDSTVATLTGSQILTNKTIDVDNNTVTNIEVDNLKSGVLDTDLTSVAATDTTLASAKAIKTYVDSQVTAQDLDFQGDTGGALSIDLDSESLTIAGGTGIDTSGATNTLTVAIDSTVATLTGTQTLTNKTLTTPIISSISNTGTLTLPTSTDTLVGRATTDTLTNKTLTSPDINTPDIDGGTIDSTVIGGTTPAAGTFTTLTANTSIAGTLSTAAQPNITSLGTLTGLDVAGTPTFDGLTVDGTGFAGMNIQAGASSLAAIDFGDSADTNIGGINYNNANDTLNLRAGNLNRLTVASNGDISFYDDTGVSQALYWDASAESLGIGTTSPSEKLEVNGNLRVFSSGYPLIDIGISTSNYFRFLHDNPNDMFKIGKNGAATLNISGSGNVGIGSTSPSSKFTNYKNTSISGTAGATLSLELNTEPRLLLTSDSSTSYISSFDSNPLTFSVTAGNFSGSTGTERMRIEADGNLRVYDVIDNITNTLTLNGRNTGEIHFQSGGSEKMRIDSSGNLLVGKTTTANATAGAELNATGQIVGTFANGTHILGRNSSDGSILEFQKDGSTVGSIGNNGDNLGIESVDVGLLFLSGSSQIIPTGGNFGVTDGTKDLGRTTTRFKDLHLSGTGYFGTSVGIGTTSPSSYQANADDLVVATTGHTGITIASGTSHLGNIHFADGTSGDDAYRGFIQYEHAANYMRFATNASEAMRIDSFGAIQIGGTSNAGFVDFDGTSLQLNTQRDPNTGVFVNTAKSHASIGLRGDNGGSDIRFGTASANNITSTERMRIDGSGNVLINRTSTSGLGKLNVDGGADFTGGDVLLCRDSGNLLVGRSSNFSGAKAEIQTSDNVTTLTLNKNNANDGEILRIAKSGVTVGSIGSRNGNSLFIALNNDTNNDAGITGSTANGGSILPCEITNGGILDNSISLGTSAARFKDLYLSGGVYLGGTTSANHLDDYEEGTWTAELKGSTTSATTPVTRTGTYTKVGNLVHVQVGFANVNTTGASGSVQVTGLPFTNTSANTSSVTMGLYSGLAHTTNNNPIMYINQGATLMQGGQMSDSAVSTNWFITGTTGVYLYVSATYTI